MADITTKPNADYARLQQALVESGINEGTMGFVLSRVDPDTLKGFHDAKRQIKLQKVVQNTLDPSFGGPQNIIELQKDVFKAVCKLTGLNSMLRPIEHRPDGGPLTPETAPELQPTPKNSTKGASTVTDKTFGAPDPATGAVGANKDKEEKENALKEAEEDAPKKAAADDPSAKKRKLRGEGPAQAGADALPPAVRPEEHSEARKAAEATAQYSAEVNKDRKEQADKVDNSHNANSSHGESVKVGKNTIVAH